MGREEAITGEALASFVVAGFDEHAGVEVEAVAGGGVGV